MGTQKQSGLELAVSPGLNFSCKSNHAPAASKCAAEIMVDQGIPG